MMNLKLKEESIKMANRDRIYYPRKYKQFSQALSNHEIKSKWITNIVFNISIFPK